MKKVLMKNILMKKIIVFSIYKNDKEPFLKNQRKALKRSMQMVAKSF